MINSKFRIQYLKSSIQNPQFIKGGCLWAFLFLILASILLTPYSSHAGSWNGWIYQNPYPTSLNLFDVKFITPAKGWVTGKYGNIFYTEDAGDTWESQETGIEEDVMRISFVNEKSGWAAGRGGTIIHTEDGGKTWTTQYNINALPTKLSFLNEKEGWVVGSTPMGVVHHTTDGGKTWEKVETGIQRAIASVNFINQQTGWILAGEDVYRTTDGGKKWEKSKLPIGKLPGMMPMPMIGGNLGAEDSLGFEWWTGGIVFVNEKQGWAAVFLWVFHTEDGGKTWTTQLDTGSMSHEFRHVSFRDTRNGCASGSTVYCTEDGGKTWKESLGVGKEGSKGLGGVYLVGQSAGWAVGNNGQILKTEDSGRNWKDVAEWDKCGGDRLFFVNGKTGWLYSPLCINTLYRTDDGGRTWEKQDIVMKVRDVYFADSLTGWAVGVIQEWKDGKEDVSTQNLINVWGVIKKTTDGGKTWKTQFKESVEKEYDLGLVRVSFINSNTGWVLAEGGGLILHTKDGGKHWERQKSGDEKYHLNKIYFIDSNLGWITGAKVSGGWTGIILYTEDGGKHWNVQHRRRDIWFNDLYFIDNKTGWVTGDTEYGEGGILLHTEDSGKKWLEKEFEAFGYTRLAFIDKERGGIYSSNGLLFITTDGGKTWIKKRTPLKKRPWHVSEVFENTQINKDLSGDEK